MKDTTMIKKIAVILMLPVLLGACVGEEKPQGGWNKRSVKMDKVEGMEDCTMHFINRFDFGADMIVIRCTGAQTVSTEDVNIIIDSKKKEIDEKIQKLVAYQKELDSIKKKYDIKDEK